MAITDMPRLITSHTQQRSERGSKNNGKSGEKAGEAQLPCNPMAERATLGVLLVEGDALKEIAEFLRPSDFYDTRWQTVYQAMLNVQERGEPGGLVTVTDELMRMGELGAVGGAAEVSALTNHVPSFLHGISYARIVARVAAQRKRMQLGAEMVSAYAAADANVAALDTYFALKIQEEGERLQNKGVSGITAAELQLLDLPEPQFVVPGLIPEGLTIIAAKQKIGKSWLALDLCLSVALGGMALGSLQVTRGDSLYLALEDTQKSLKRRIRMLLGDELRWPEAARLETEWPRLHEGGVQALERWLDDHVDARLVVVDVLAKVRPPRGKNGNLYEEDYAVMGPLKALADKFHCAIVIIHHARKSEAVDVFDEILDSAGLTGSADAAMVLKRSRTEADAVLHVTGRNVDEAEYALRFDKTRGQWTLLGDAKEHAITGQRKAVVDLLELSGPLAPKEIATALGNDPGSTRVLISRMLHDQLLTFEAGGRYTVKK